MTEKFLPWKALDDGRVVKELDYSSFNHGCSVVPQPFYSFFNITDDDSSIELICKNGGYTAELQWTRPNSPLLRIFWGNELMSVLKSKFSDWEKIKQQDRATSMKVIFRKDGNKNIFHIDLVDIYSAENERINFDMKVAESLKNPPKSPKGSTTPAKKTLTSQQTVRDPEVYAWILHKSNWICECCDKPSPFQKPDGAEYLEVHHLKRLADGGSDTIGNAIAVCPNCHRELHYGSRRMEKLESVYKKIERLIRE